MAGSLVLNNMALTGEDMTAAGYLDWKDYSTGSGGANDQRKNITAILGSVAMVGSALRIAGGQWSGNSYSWTDGTPTASSNDGVTASGAYFQCTTNGGADKITFSAPAGTGTKRVRLLWGYMESNNGAGQVATVRGSLSDGSAAAVSDTVTTVGFNSIWKRTEFVYNAASAGQTFTASVEPTSGAQIAGTQLCVQCIVYGN